MLVIALAPLITLLTKAFSLLGVDQPKVGVVVTVNQSINLKGELVEVYIHTEEDGLLSITTQENDNEILYNYLKELNTGDKVVILDK